MTDRKKACVIYAPGLSECAERVERELLDLGFEVCLHGAMGAEVEAVRGDATSLSKELVDCLASASLCVLVVDERGQFDAVAARTAELSIRIVVVMVGVDAEPSGAVDEIAGSCVTVTSGHLGAALDGEEIWEEPNGSPKKPRDIRRQRCQ